MRATGENHDSSTVRCSVEAREENLVKEFSSATSSTLVATRIRDLNLSGAQRKQVVEIIDAVLTDAFYTLLLGLDGSASIGGVQQTYKIYGEDGKLISDCGEIEAEAAEAFQ